jgi:hypothetical protein
MIGQPNFFTTPAPLLTFPISSPKKHFRFTRALEKLNRDDHPGVPSFTEPFKTKYKENISRLEDELSTLGDQCQKIGGLEDRLTDFDILKTDLFDLKQSIADLQQNTHRDTSDPQQTYFF